MSKTAIGLFLAGLCASSAGFAQDAAAPPRAARAEAVNPSVEAGVAHLAARATFSPQEAPSRQQLLGILLVISLGNNKGRGA
jgi:hypothetical protein